MDYHRHMKPLRYVARTLALIWAVWWLFFGLASGAGEGFKGLLANAPNALPALAFCVCVAVAWRWDFAGGVLLLLCGLTALYALRTSEHLSFMLLIMVLPPAVAGSLFILSRRTRREPGVRQNTA